MEVSAEGYETQKEWIELKNGEKKGIAISMREGTKGQFNITIKR